MSGTEKRLFRAASWFAWCLVVIFLVKISTAERQSLDFNTPCSRRRLARSSDADHPDHTEYAVVIDAGSSGSRVRVYRWPAGVKGHVEVSGIVSVTPTLKIQPGLSALEGNNPAIRDHISRLVENASRIIPQEEHSTTPIYVMATAGMRLLLEEKMNEVVHYIDSLMRDSTVNPFRYASYTDTRILSGEEEGVFAWITVNYLVDSFKKNGNGGPGERPTVGILEMGGASTQIAFVPRGNVLADKFPVTIGRMMYPLYVHSYLDYGQNNVERWLKDRLIKDNPTVTAPDRINNPCMLQGDTDVNKAFNRTFVGTGEPYLCLDHLRKHVYKAETVRCQPKPCAIGSFYQPTLPPNMTFYAIGAYIYTLKSIGALTEDGLYVPSVGYQKAVEFCQRPISEHRSRITEASEQKYIKSKCLLGLYFALLFNHGYGFPNDTKHIYVLDKINGQPPDWTLGAVLYESVQLGCGMQLENLPVYGQSSDAARSSFASPCMPILLLLLGVFINLSLC